jgi:hypothetical protein
MKVSFGAVEAMEAITKERAVRGSDLIIFLEGPDKTPATKEVRERKKEEDLRRDFGGDDAIVFVKNKNLQKFPPYMRGAILWTQLSSTLSIIAIVIKANGHQAFVEILFPLPRKGEKLLIETQRVEGGAYLQQLLGPPVVEFDQTF